MQNKQKKIVIALNYLISENIFGGVDKLIITLTKELKKINYIVDIYFPQLPGSNSYHYNINDIDVKLIKSKLFSDSLVNELKNQSYDLLILHFFTPYTKYLKEYKRFVPKIITVEHMSRPINGKSIKRKLKDKLSCFLYSKYLDRKIHCCKYLQTEDEKDYGKYSIKNSSVIYNGINCDLNDISFQSNNDRIKILAIGRLVKEKGFQHLIEALNLLNDNMYELNICGDGIYRKELESMVKFKNIHFNGFVSNVDKKIEESDILVLPSYQEAFPFVILEALSKGKIVIATKVGGVPEIFKNNVNGFLINPKNTDELLNIIKSIKNKNLLSMRKEALNTVINNFSFEKMINEHKEIIMKELAK